MNYEAQVAFLPLNSATWLAGTIDIFNSDTDFRIRVNNSITPVWESPEEDKTHYDSTEIELNSIVLLSE